MTASHHPTPVTPTPVNVEAYKRVIRSEICAGCERRRPHGAMVDPARALACEHDCGIFVHLPQLVQLARLRDPMLVDSAAAKSSTDSAAMAINSLARVVRR